MAFLAFLFDFVLYDLGVIFVSVLILLRKGLVKQLRAGLELELTV